MPVVECPTCGSDCEKEDLVECCDCGTEICPSCVEDDMCPSCKAEEDDECD